MESAFLSALSFHVLATLALLGVAALQALRPGRQRPDETA